MTFAWPPFPRRRRRPARPWAPLTDAEWEALRPFVDTPGPGRPIADPRARMDALFQAVTTRGLRWSHHTPAQGRADTLHRHFRRLAHAGVWTALLKQVARRRCARPLRALRDWVCAAHRRAVRVLGLASIVLARRLGLARALPGPAWLLPDPDLSESLKAAQEALLQRRDDPALPGLLRVFGRLLRDVGRRRPIAACLEPR
jgi:transposase